MSNSTTSTYSDITLIGAGIMSATLGTFLNELSAEKSIVMFEKLSAAALESSNEWNNAGTGHSALCELNYTAEQPDGSIETQRALNVFEQFQLSLQFWSYLAEQGKLGNPQEFVRCLPHMSFVQGEKNVAFLRKRYETLSTIPYFKEMKFSQDHATLAEWIPLMMENRDPNEAVAATHIANGTDMNFGELTRKLFANLQRAGAELNFNQNVTEITRLETGEWQVTLNNQGQIRQHRTKFIFLGGGGGTLPLLQKSGVPEGKNVGGLPVSGLFIVCKNQDVVARHFAKVYGKAKVGAPPMSVPHLDTRFIEGKQTLLFGPFAGFTFKFLKEGSQLDFIKSLTLGNVVSTSLAGLKNLPLANYLVKQAMLSKEQRMAELREFIPTAQSEDWDLVVAGQRVQIIRDDEMRFGTEVLHNEDGSLAALLGASPGASISVKAMLDVITQCFASELPQWQSKLEQMLPSFGKKLADNPELYTQIKQHAETHLGLK